MSLKLTITETSKRVLSEMSGRKPKNSCRNVLDFNKDMLNKFKEF